MALATTVQKNIPSKQNRAAADHLLRYSLVMVTLKRTPARFPWVIAYLPISPFVRIPSSWCDDRPQGSQARSPLDAAAPPKPQFQPWQKETKYPYLGRSRSYMTLMHGVEKYPYLDNQIIILNSLGTIQR